MLLISIPLFVLFSYSIHGAQLGILRGNGSFSTKQDIVKSVEEDRA